MFFFFRCSLGSTQGISGAFFYLEVVGVELMALGAHFENWGSLRSPVLCILVSLGIYVELVHEVLDVTLLLDGQKFILEFLSDGLILVSVSLYWWLSASSTA